MAHKVRRDLLPALAAVVAVLLLAAGYWQIARMGARLDQAETDRAAVAKAMADANSNVAALQKQVKGLGGQPVAGPVPMPERGVQGVPGPQGPAGPGPTRQQIDDGLSRYLTLHPPARGAKGEPGSSVTQAQAATLVAAYLQTHPPASGKDGRDGQDGAPGPGPTQQQIATEVAAYLQAHPPAAGEKGDPGEPGRPPTAEEISAAVSSWMAGHDLYCTPPGPLGQVKDEPWPCEFRSK
jgi:hypothetical protein